MNLSHFFSLNINSQFAQIYVHSRIGKTEMSSSPEEIYIAEYLRHVSLWWGVLGLWPVAPL